jgi:DNA polymerase elongation subunit (family B)
MCLRCECKYYDTEKELIIGFADLVKELKPDVITGFYNVFFDFPYIFKRTEKLFGNLNIFKEISPFKMLEKVKIQDDREKVINSYEIVGVPIIDYRSLYYRFTQKRLGSYSLANILIAEKIFLKKVEKDMGFFEAYTEHTQMFCTYSLVDVLALKLLINKTNYIFSYYFYMERFSISAEQYNKPVVFWDNRYYQFLKDKNIIIPPHTKQEEYERIEGAYNKEPIKNKVGYSVVCDVKSLYPMLMILFNISPETYVSNDFIKDKKLLEYSRKASQKISTDKADIDYSKGIDMYLADEIDAKYIASKGLIMAPNGAFFDVREKGMIPQLMQIDFSARQEKAKKAEESYQKAKVTHNQEEANQLMIEYANNEGLQYNIKISINSCYGTLLSIYNRYFNPACGGAITSGGHLCIRYIIAETNKMINKYLNTKDEDYVIASSTDSMYVDLDLYYDKFYKGDRTNKFEIVLFLNEFCKNILAPFLAKSFDILERRLGSKEKVLRMPIEAILDSGVWLDKRNYVIRPVSDDKNLFYEKPKLKIKGNTLVSSSYPKFALKNIESIFIQILDGVDGKTIKQNMEKLKKEYVKLPLKDVAINISLSSLDNYMVEEDNLSGTTVQIAEKGTPQHSKGAINFNNLIDKYNLDENLKLTSGNKVGMLLLKYDNPLGIDEICFSDKLPKEFGIEPFVDYDRMFSRVFENIICNKILEPLAMNVNVDALWG